VRDEECKLCWDLLITSENPTGRVSKDEFSRRFPSALEQGKLALRLLDETFDARNAEDLECALIVGHVFGFGPEHVDVLCHLIDADWHYSHEDVVDALDDLRSPKAIDALFRATQCVPKSLEYDVNRNLAVKAIWALGNLQDSEADAKLEVLSRSNDAIGQEAAAKQLERRREAT
jgi:hypothetical protein